MCFHFTRLPVFAVLGDNIIISPPVSKKRKNRFPIFIGKRFFCFFIPLGVGYPRWDNFEKSALKSPETRMNTKKIGVTSILSPFLGLRHKKDTCFGAGAKQNTPRKVRSATCVQAQPAGALGGTRRRPYCTRRSASPSFFLFGFFPYQFLPTCSRGFFVCPHA